MNHRLSCFLSPSQGLAAAGMLLLLALLHGVGADTEIEVLIANVKDIFPGASSSNPSDLEDFKDKIFFSADDGTHGRELWVSDGTPQGTTMVVDLVPGSASSDPTELTESNNFLFFAATTPNEGRELWATDGTAVGTNVVDLNPGAASSNPEIRIKFNGGTNIAFTATTVEYGEEVWVSDGSLGGTFLLKDISPGSAGSNPGLFRVVNEKLVFVANDGTHGRELWVSTDGTTENTQLLKDILPGENEPDFDVSRLALPVSSSSAADQLFFAADGDLWKTDGSPEGTLLIRSGLGISNANHFSRNVTNGKALFMAASDRIARAGQLGLWATDGTSTGTSVFFDDFVGSLNSASISVSANDVSAYAFGPKFDHGNTCLLTQSTTNPSRFEYHLWTTDGTEAGTALISDRPLGRPRAATSMAIRQLWVLVESFANDNRSRIWVTDCKNSLVLGATFEDGTSEDLTVGDLDDFLLQETVLFRGVNPTVGFGLYKLEVQEKEEEPTDDDSGTCRICSRSMVVLLLSILFCSLLDDLVSIGFLEFVVLNSYGRILWRGRDIA